MGIKVQLYCDVCKTEVRTRDGLLKLEFPRSVYPRQLYAEKDEKGIMGTVAHWDPKAEVCSRGCAHDLIDAVYNASEG